MAFEAFGQLSKRRRAERAEEFKKKILIAVLGGIFVLLCIVGGVIAFLHIKDHNEKTHNNDQSKNGDVSGNQDHEKASSKIVQLLCEPTDYKKSCEGALTKLVNVTESHPAIEPRLIVKTAISAALDEVVKAANKTGALKFDKDEDKAAYDVCKKLFEDSTQELGRSVNHTEKQEDFTSSVDNVKTWLSAVYSYQETCIDAFSDGKNKDDIKSSLNTTKEFVSNALALISQISTLIEDESKIYEGLPPGSAPALAPGASDFDSESSSARRLLAHRAVNEPPHVNEEGFPEWVGHEERKLVVKATANLKPNITVAKDGSGDYKSINECLKKLPENRKERIFIYVKEGWYDEYVTITKNMVNITMYGDGSQKSMVTGNKNFVDGVRTFETATFAVLGEGFIGIAIGFRNTAGPQKHQAVALRVQADRSIFLNCRMEGYQDTLYAQTHRQFYRSCYITGTIDFIFGDAAAIFQNCEIMVRKPMENQQNIVTAQGRADRHENTGFVLHNCKILPDTELEPEKHKVKTYLGRPWKEYSRTIVMESNIGDLLQPEGWLPWQGDFALKTLYYAEFNNNGPGAEVINRVKWPGYKKTISRQEAQNYTVMPFIQGTWIREASIPVPAHYSLLS